MLAALRKQLTGFERDSVMTPVFMVLEVLMETLIPYLMASIIDNGVDMGDINHIYKIGGIMVVVAGIGLFAGVMGGKYGARASAGFARNLRRGMFENIQTFSFSNIDHFSTAGLVTRMTTDVTNIQNAYQMILRMCVRAPISLICAMAMAFFINVRIASIYFVAIIILSGILAVIIKFAMKYFSELFQKYDDLNSSIQENVAGIRIVKACVREDFEKERFMKANGNLYKMFVRAEKIITYNGPVMMLTVYSCILFISWIGAKMIVSSGGTDLTTGNLMSLLAYCMNILMSLMFISVIFVMITLSLPSGKRVAEVLNEKTDIGQPESPVLSVKDGSIEFKDVVFRYYKESEEPVLDNVNISINSGETIGIVGGTGSSKTTLVNLICRLYDVDKGSVKVGGVDVKNYDLDTLRNQVSVVLQKNVLFSGTILENLRWGDKNASMEDCIRACELACADEFIEGFPDKYETRIEQGGTNVSGGQKQRLCIARALLKKPKILILDDSTSAVDTATDAKIRKSFREEIPGTTKIIIAQRITSVMDADKIIVMENGKIDGVGAHDELLKTNEIYRDIYESQTKGNGDFDEI